MPQAPHFSRVLLKLSGEALCAPGSLGIDPQEIKLIAQEVANAAQQGTQLAIVVGGGNILRGATLAQTVGFKQAQADYMGMLGTVINAMALKETLEALGQPAQVMSALPIGTIVEPYNRAQALEHLENNRVLIFAGGTGNPFFTTDSAAALRAAEIDADAVLKATKVDGIYDKDPNQFDDAVRYETLTFQEAIEKKLGVMDTTAFAMCQERNIPIVVFDMKKPGNIAEVVAGTPHGTRVISD